MNRKTYFRGIIVQFRYGIFFLRVVSGSDSLGYPDPDPSREKHPGAGSSPIKLHCSFDNKVNIIIFYYLIVPLVKKYEKKRQVLKERFVYMASTFVHIMGLNLFCLWSLLLQSYGHYYGHKGINVSYGNVGFPSFEVSSSSCIRMRL